jgi:hypothetical protein
MLTMAVARRQVSTVRKVRISTHMAAMPAVAVAMAVAMTVVMALAVVAAAAAAPAAMVLVVLVMVAVRAAVRRSGPVALFLRFLRLLVSVGRVSS